MKKPYSPEIFRTFVLVFGLVGFLFWAIALLAPAWKEASRARAGVPLAELAAAAATIESQVRRSCFEWVSDRKNHPQIFAPRPYGFRYPRPHECGNCHPRKSSHWIEACQVNVGKSNF